MTIELDGNAVALGRGALRALRESLLSDLGDQGPQCLQEAGHAGGADLYACFQQWLAAQLGVNDPGSLDSAVFSSVMGDFFEALGWGRISIEQIGRGGLALDALQWAEADPEAQAPYPSCHLSAGILADFMGRLASRSISVMEVECRSSGQERCRFLLGNPEMIQAVYDAVSEGKDYRSALPT